MSDGDGAPRGLEALVRPNVRALAPYASARDEFTGEARVMLDANENAIGSPVGPDAGLPGGANRYPDPHQRALKARLAELSGVRADQVFVGNGSDEILDLVIRLVCVPGRDSIVVTPPTYGMYEVAAGVNDVAVERVPLGPDFALDDRAVEALVGSRAKVAFLCTPNNPTGNVLAARAVERVLAGFAGIVVVDEAYGDFAEAASFAARLDAHPRLLVVRTLSKAWGMASLRVGVGLASAELVGWLDRIKPPYNVSGASQALALRGLADVAGFERTRRALLDGRAWLELELAKLAVVERVFPSSANFLLVRVREDATDVYRALLARGIVVRNRTTQPGCAGCLRITVGTPDENAALVAALDAIGKGAAPGAPAEGAP